MTRGGPEQETSLPGLSTEEAAALAERHGLQRVGTRPRFGTYLKETWKKRRFLWTLSSGQSHARNQDNYLGQLWSVLTPLLLAGAYFVVFGLLLGTSGDVDNFVGFLTAGIFLFIYISASLSSGAKSITGNTGLVRALRFPRCLLPLSVTLTELIATLPAFAVLLGIMLVSGESPQWSWLLYPVAIALVTVINSGLALIAARLVHSFRDLANLIPIITRLLRYSSGVFFPIAYYVEQHPFDEYPVVGTMMVYQPVAVSLTVIRQTLMGQFELDPTTWAVAGGWAVLLFVGGFIAFWRAEAQYGRA